MDEDRPNTAPQRTTGAILSKRNARMLSDASAEAHWGTWHRLLTEAVVRTVRDRVLGVRTPRTLELDWEHAWSRIPFVLEDRGGRVVSERHGGAADRLGTRAIAPSSFPFSSFAVPSTSPCIMHFALSLILSLFFFVAFFAIFTKRSQRTWPEVVSAAYCLTGRISQLLPLNCFDCTLDICSAFKIFCGQ